jgi:hypothetical protein
VHEVLTSPGQPLDRPTRSFFEPRFGRDLSNVRVHADEKAAESARTVSAHAYAVAQHMVFAKGRYQPGSSEGRRLLAHELTHTIQQGRTSSNFVSHGTLGIGPTNDSFENQAHAVAEGMSRSDRSVASMVSSGFGRGAVRALQRNEDKYANLSIPELRKLLKTDPEAAEALRLRYRSMSPGDLKRYTVNDAIAQSEYERKTIVPKEAPTTAPFSNRDVGKALKDELEQQRAESGKERRTSSAVTPGIKTEGGTLGAAKTDIPGLESRVFTGRSPQVGGKVNPASKFAPATDPEVLPQTHGHAEQHIADQLEEALKGIPREQLKGKRVWMLIEQEPCSTCASGVTGEAAPAGVLRKLSQEFPELTFEIKNLTSNSLIVLRGGTRTNVSGAAASGAQPLPGGKGTGPASADSATHPAGTLNPRNVASTRAAASAGKSPKKMTAKTRTPLKPPPEAGATPEVKPPAPAAKAPAAASGPRPQISGGESHEGEPPNMPAAKAAPKGSPGELEGEGHVPPIRRPAGVPKPGVTPEIEPEAPHTTPAPRVGAQPPGASGPELEGGEMGAAAGAAIGEAIKAVGAILIQKYFVDPQNEEAINKQLEEMKPEIGKRIEANKNQILTLTRSGKSAYVNVTVEIEYQADHETGLNFFAGLKLVTVEIGGSPVQKEEPAEKGWVKSFFYQKIGHTDLLITFPEYEYHAKEGAAAPPVKAPAVAPKAPAPAHATPPGVKLPSTPQGFPSIEEQRGKRPCPTCHDQAEPKDELHIPEEFKKPMMTDDEMRAWLRGQGH